MLNVLDDARGVARFLANLRCYEQANIERALVNAMKCTPDEARRLAGEAIANRPKED